LRKVRKNALNKTLLHDGINMYIYIYVQTTARNSINKGEQQDYIQNSRIPISQSIINNPASRGQLTFVKSAGDVRRNIVQKRQLFYSVRVALGGQTSRLFHSLMSIYRLILVLDIPCMNSQKYRVETSSTGPFVGMEDSGDVKGCISYIIGRYLLSAILL
jgi:hypothetical protein